MIKGILLCAYMGIVAFNIVGQTICSAFHKKMYQTNQIMSADELNTFRIKYRHLKVVIIDEISILVTRTLNCIHTTAAVDRNKSTFWWFKCYCCR